MDSKRLSNWLDLLIVLIIAFSIILVPNLHHPITLVCTGMRRVVGNPGVCNFCFLEVPLLWWEICTYEIAFGWIVASRFCGLL